MPAHVITSTAGGPFTPSQQGKVRDIYALGDRLLLCATDRLSAFDVILPDGIPGKGEVLTRISAFWFQKLSHVVPHHLISIEQEDLPEPFRSRPDIFAGRSMLVRASRPLPVECIVRGYLSGSGWSEYKRTGSVCGITLPAGLRESDELPEPIFTPTTKAAIGEHDENITFEQMSDILGAGRAREVRDVSIRLYKEGAAHARTRGIIIADTKFEFGVDEKGGLVWIDEAMTPDSSRFWPVAAYVPGGAQPSFDKQFVRDYLTAIKWDKRPPAPSLPADVIATTARKYGEALALITGSSLQ
ncbi:MAG: phosphoribosylaminoimidazolesuccinocarboxamide synthase [Ignavibacteriae bacterium]|nr:phosphoribosylaminoimidazolesuccinocarboxamide synthase [Ignavibacteriota bacterium]